MMDLSECLTEDSEILIIENSKKRRIRRKKEPQRTKIYHKPFNHAEFIGEELCAIHNIRCTHYFLVGVGGYFLGNKNAVPNEDGFHMASYDFLKPAGEYDLQRMVYYGDIVPKDYDFYIASYDFHRPGREYHYLREYFDNDDVDKFSEMLSKAKDSENEEKLCREMLQLMALDIFMGQIDRCDENIIFEETEDGNLRLAPLFDFERSLKLGYLSDSTICGGELYSFSSIDECKRFIKGYPLFRDILGSYLDIDLKEVIERAYHRRSLTIPDDKWQYYQELESKRKELIRRIVN